MGVKGDNLGINSGLLLQSFTLNYMVIRVKEKELNKEKEERDIKRGRTIERREKRRGKQRFWEIACLIANSSVEVGYGLCYLIVNSKYRLICIG